MPPIAGSAAQAGFQQVEASRIRDAAQAGQSHAGQRSAQSITEAGDTIETSDEDMGVFADAEGAGGQGRHLEDEHGHHDETEDTTKRGGISRDDDGHLHVDLEA